MVRRVPAPVLIVPLEHGEVGHPEELEILRVEQFVPVGELLRAVQAQLPAGQVDGLLGTVSGGLARPGGQHQQIVLAGAGALPHLPHALGIVAVEALGVVVDAQPLFIAERLHLVALLAAGRAGIGNVDGLQR